MSLQDHALYASAVTAVSAGDTLTLTGTVALDSLDQGFLRWFAGIEFYTSSAGTTVATPTAGTLVIQVKTTELPGVWQDISASAVDLSVANTSMDWMGRTLAVKVSGITGVSGGSATHYRLRASGSL